jgi:undecaprenyl-diphosphatase
LADSKRILITMILTGMLVYCAFAAAPSAPSDSTVAPDADAAPVSMSLLDAAIIGVIEGLTEYLPVSSTGHIILAQRALGIPDSEEANAFAICVQAGAIFAVLGLYQARVRQMALGAVNRDRHGQRLLFNILVAFAPAAVFGLMFNDVIEKNLFGLWPIAGAWAVGGAAILAITWSGKEKYPPQGFDLEHLSRKRAILIGLLQCLAMWPGVSRSLMTIVGGVIVGLSLPAAVEFSFLLGLVTLSAATVYKALQYGPQMFELYGPSAMVVGFLTALLAAIISVKWMVAYLNKHGLSIFGYYRVGLAVVVIVLIVLGVLTPN